MTKENITNHHSRRISHMFGDAVHAITYLYFLTVLQSAAAQSSNEPPPPNPYINPNYKPSMAVSIAVLLGAFVFIGIFAIYLRHCSHQSQMGGSIRPVNVGGRSRRMTRGLDSSVIETFPTLVYSVVKGLKLGKGTLECAVCLNEFEDDETLRLLPKCDHVFHPECIDVWLASHTTCPVCRTDLVPVTGEGVSATQVPDSDSGSEEENRSSEVNDLQNQVSIRVTDDQITDSHPDVINTTTQIPVQNRPGRARSTRPRIGGKFPRSHSTGHSLIRPGENCERFTLKLPEDVRKQIVNGKLNRTASCINFPTRQGSVSGGSIRQGHRISGGGSSRGKNSLFGRTGNSERWIFSIAPPFFWRTSSVRSDKKADESVKSPFEFSGAKSNSADQNSSARPPV